MVLTPHINILPLIAPRDTHARLVEVLPKVVLQQRTSIIALPDLQRPRPRHQRSNAIRTDASLVAGPARRIDARGVPPIKLGVRLVEERSAGADVNAGIVLERRAEVEARRHRCCCCCAVVVSFRHAVALHPRQVRGHDAVAEIRRPHVAERPVLQRAYVRRRVFVRVRTPYFPAARYAAGELLCGAEIGEGREGYCF